MRQLVEKLGARTGWTAAEAREGPAVRATAPE